MAWTPKPKQSETWTNRERPTIGVGFSPLFAARPAFAIAYLAGHWTPKTEQPETWTEA